MHRENSGMGTIIPEHGNSRMRLTALELPCPESLCHQRRPQHHRRDEGSACKRGSKGKNLLSCNCLRLATWPGSEQAPGKYSSLHVFGFFGVVFLAAAPGSATMPGLFGPALQARLEWICLKL